MSSALFFALFPLIASIHPNLGSNLSSDEASFDGDHVFLKGHVTLIHDMGLMHADKITLQKGEHPTAFKEADLEENVTAFFQDTSELHSEKAHFDFLNKTGVAFSEKKLVHFRDQKEELFDLFCKEIHFTFENNVLETLEAKSNIQIDYGPYHLDGDETVTVIKKSIEAKGPTTLTMPEQQTLTSLGTLSLCRDDLKIVAASPTQKQVVPLAKQLKWEKKETTLFADRAQIDLNDSFHPRYVTLHGLVRLIIEESDAHTTVGIADRVEYDPEKEVMRLLADPGQDVLVWSEEKKLQLCAPEVLITTDPKTKEKIYKGLGRVRLSFDEEQEKKLLRHFHL